MIVCIVCYFNGTHLDFLVLLCLFNHCRSVCGYDTSARQLLHNRRKQDSQPRAPSTKTWERRAPYDYFECLAHADVTFLQSSGEVKRVLGILKHTNQCSNAVMTRLPAIPLHPHVVEIALAQLSEGVRSELCIPFYLPYIDQGLLENSITGVQMKNTELLAKQVYRGMNINVNLLNHRYQILGTDFSALYRQHSCQNGIDVSLSPEYNLHHWMDPEHAHFKPELQRAIFYYRARAEREDRLKVCISTKEMDDAAWKYGHQSQIIIDGTFGVCSTRLLLFISMGVDEKNQGVPLALLLFSAPTGNRATHAGYNTAILVELLMSWKSHLGLRDGYPFTPAVAITDTDTKERGALIRVWSDMVLLLCRFHLRQCWTNKRKTLFRISKDNEAKEAGFWRDHVAGRLRLLELA